MIGWLSLTDVQRRASLEQASVRSGIMAKAIEKDWWVTLSLKALFQTEFAKFCIFKGGTSLSKGWKLIERFSEDIDIALDPAAFGMEYVKAPTHSYVKKLKRAGCQFTSTTLKDAIANSFVNLGITNAIEIVVDEVLPHLPDKDPQTLFIRYTSLYDPHPYLADEVKMEFSVRSLKEPFANVSIQSLLNEFFPNPIYSEVPFEVVAVEPRKTLLEKAFLLHEKFSFGYPEAIKDDRQSRHIYDLVQLMESPAGEEALTDTSLYNTLLEHRRHYVRLSGLDYDTLKKTTLNFVPSIESVLLYFQDDYATMQGSMIYGNSHSFEDLLLRLKILNGKFRLMGSGFTLEKLIEQSVSEIPLNTNVNIHRQPIEMLGAEEKSNKFVVTFHRRKDGWIFDKIDIVS